MDRIEELVSFLQTLIIIGSAGRITFCCMAIQQAEDSSQYIKRIKHVLIFVIISVSFIEWIEMLLSYF